ncbi:Imm50 family immunity protein [Streptomyces sp. NPDC101118]|uniref:Imm50 family immunity protein n=1 Tax=Streptomyces sp. NPDC101118 TaxID=3366109 RepID=UPI0037F989D7
MSTSDPGPLAALHDLYDTPPGLAECRLFSVHVDERDVSVTLRFETSALPDRPRPAWTGRPYNTFCFSLLFSGVAALRLRGLLADGESETSLRPTEDDRLAVTVAGPHRLIEFTAATATLAAPEVRLHGSL